MERPAGDADGAVPPIQTAELRSLMASTLDFVGISAYGATLTTGRAPPRGLCFCGHTVPFSVAQS
jgi:hypothetical protein